MCQNLKQACYAQQLQKSIHTCLKDHYQIVPCFFFLYFALPFEENIPKYSLSSSMNVKSDTQNVIIQIRKTDTGHIYRIGMIIQIFDLSHTAIRLLIMNYKFRIMNFEFDDFDKLKMMNMLHKMCNISCCHTRHFLCETIS